MLDNAKHKDKQTNFTQQSNNDFDHVISCPDCGAEINDPGIDSWSYHEDGICIRCAGQYLRDQKAHHEEILESWGA